MSIVKNTAYNLMGALVPFALAIFTIPIYLRSVGDERYGVLAIAWLLLGYFGVFDLGLGRATAQRVSSIKSQDLSLKATVVWTALSTNSCIGILGGTLIWPVGYYYFSEVMVLDQVLRHEILKSLPWLILAVPVSTMQGVLVGTLQGIERFGELNIISTVGTTLVQIAPLVAMYFLGSSLDVLIPTAVIARAFNLAVLFMVIKMTLLPMRKLSFSVDEAKRLLGFGGWVTISAFVGPIMVVFDRFVIGALEGAKSVSYYTIPFQLGNRSLIIASSFISALFPRLVSASSSGTDEKLARVALNSLIVVMTPVILAGIFIMEPFLSLWISEEFAQKSFLIGQVLLLGLWINTIARVPLVLLEARRRPDIVAKCHVAELLPYLALLWVALSEFGMLGATYAFCVRVTADYLLLSGFSGLLRTAVVSVLAPGCLLVIGFLIEYFTTSGSVLWFATATAHMALVLSWSIWQAPTEMKQKWTTYRKSILQI